MALAEALLVDAQVGNRLCLATFEPTWHGAFQDAVNLVPAQRQQRGDACWLASLSQQIARASNSAVKRLEASAQGSRTTRGPYSGQSLRGGRACRTVRY